MSRKPSERKHCLVCVLKMNRTSPGGQGWGGHLSHRPCDWAKAQMCVCISRVRIVGVGVQRAHTGRLDQRRKGQTARGLLVVPGAWD